MKTYKFEIVFKSGKSWIGYASSSSQAVILASAWAIENALDRTIDMVIDEDYNTQSAELSVTLKTI